MPKRAERFGYGETLLTARADIYGQKRLVRKAPLDEAHRRNGSVCFCDLRNNLEATLLLVAVVVLLQSTPQQQPQQQ